MQKHSLRGLPVGRVHALQGHTRSSVRAQEKPDLTSGLSSKEELGFTNVSYTDWQCYRHTAYTYTHMRKGHVQKVWKK